MRKFFSEHKFEIFFISFFILFCTFAVLLCYNTDKEYQLQKEQYQEWFNSLTPEQQQAERIKQDQRRYSRYEVISVTRYYKTNTNQWGGVTSSELCYAFVYLDGNGNAHHVEDFIDAPYGRMKVTIGNSNKYIIDKIRSVRYLQLTKETFGGLK